ncbi:MAG: SCO family protein [Acidobacteriota bacterium]
MRGKRKAVAAAPAFDRHTPEERIAGFVDQVRAAPEQKQVLVALLREAHPLYQGRGTQECIRLRGYILAAFESTGLPPSALIFALEDLYNTRSAYLIAGAAMAIRGMDTPHPEIVPYLLEAVVNIRLMDDAVCFDTYKPVWPAPRATSGLREVFKTFHWMGAYAAAALPRLEEYAQESAGFHREVRELIEAAIVAIESDPREVDLSCCGPSPKMAGRTTHRTRSWLGKPQLTGMVLEDQDGNELRSEAFFLGKPTVVSFFYTRCNSINKCSLTVGNTGALAKRLEEMGLGEAVNLALITYDPAYDLPARIRVYAENRRCEFSDSFKALRATPGDFDRLKSHFGLEVGYSASIVNQHRVETYVLDHQGRIRHTLSRIQWDADEIMDRVAALAKAVDGGRAERIVKAVSKHAGATVLPFLIVVFPKCQLCWTSYLSAFGIASLKEIPFAPWLVPVFAAGIGINLWGLYRSGKRRNGLLPFWLSCLGAVTLLVGGYWLEYRAGSYIGISMIFAGSILNSLPYSTYLRLRAWGEGLRGWLLPAGVVATAEEGGN